MKTEYQSYIHGKPSQQRVQNLWHPNIYPGTNEVINQIMYASDADIAQAIESSHQAFQTWSQTPLNKRSEILLRAAMILREKNKELAELEVWDTGKPIVEATNVDIHSAANTLEYFAKIAHAYENHIIPHHESLIYTQREPLGVCVGIGAFNYPLQIACWKAAPALIMGNTMVYKPSELTPMTTVELADIFLQAGLPVGVFNVVLGDGTIAEKLLQQPHVAKVSFTGSLNTGKKILKQTSERLIPTTLELGGKSPFIIFNDADVEQAVIASILANFYTQGEICSNGTRVFVEQNVYETFIKKLSQRVKNLVIGNPFETTTQIGALISRNHLAKVLNYIESGKKEGAKLICGGKQVTTPTLYQGNFVEPTVFVQCSDHMTIVQDEIFGPVMSVLTFEDDDEVIARANNTAFGLAAGIFTENIKRAHYTAKKLQAGVCWINNYNVTPVGMPFGGYKLSGLGRENGLVTLSHYSQLKSIYVELKQIDHAY